MAKKNEDLTATYEGPLVSDTGDQAVVRDVSTDEVPDGTILEVEQWVSDDKARAAAALEVEEAKGDDARTTLIHDLERIADEA